MPIYLRWVAYAFLLTTLQPLCDQRSWFFLVHVSQVKPLFIFFWELVYFQPNPTCWELPKNEVTQFLTGYGFAKLVWLFLLRWWRCNIYLLMEMSYVITLLFHYFINFRKSKTKSESRKWHSSTFFLFQSSNENFFFKFSILFVNNF